ncbi:leucine-rich repeat extensin-like protein 5 [Microcaecilia unicolor]|uniref:Leucine-rich repeat extensin-like protein 5 n=1 Tax=Microcaecilia unicolor TaxID=1415580 RepID=A0A6P7X4I0_9AMPH|nr:leucine-rich repeat extensin-like protein 5 [Microcaecilia unicolor]
MSDDNEDGGIPPMLDVEEACPAEASPGPSRPATPTLPFLDCTPSPSLQALLTNSTIPPPPPPSVSASIDTFPETAPFHEDTLPAAVLPPVPTSAVQMIESKFNYHVSDDNEEDGGIPPMLDVEEACPAEASSGPSCPATPTPPSLDCTPSPNLQALLTHSTISPPPPPIFASLDTFPDPEMVPFHECTLPAAVLPVPTTAVQVIESKFNHHMSDDNEEDGGTPPMLDVEEACPAEASPGPSRPATPTPPSLECTPTPSLQALLTDATIPPPPPPSISASIDTFPDSETVSFYEVTLPAAVLPPVPTSAVQMIESKEHFDEALIEAGDKLIVIDFTASWCGPCQMIAPFFEALSQRHNARVAFLKVDVDDVSDVADDFGIVAMPTFVFLKNGEKIDEFCGDCPDTLAAKIILLK